MQFTAITNKAGDAIVGISLNLESAQKGTDAYRLCLSRVKSVTERFPRLTETLVDLETRHATTLDGLVELAKAGALVTADLVALEMALKGRAAMESALRPRLGASTLFAALQGKGAFAVAITNAVRRVVRDNLRLDAIPDADME